MSALGEGAIVAPKSLRIGLAFVLVPMLAAPPLALCDEQPKKERTDQHGDPLPGGAIARLGSTRFRQGSWVRDLSLSPDGKTIAAVEFNKVRLWDSATGKELRCFPLVSAGGSDRSGESGAFAPDGKTLAVGGAPNSTR
jgi:WD40 repeat protein